MCYHIFLCLFCIIDVATVATSWIAVLKVHKYKALMQSLALSSLYEYFLSYSQIDVFLCQVVNSFAFFLKVHPPIIAYTRFQIICGFDLPASYSLSFLSMDCV